MKKQISGYKANYKYEPLTHWTSILKNLISEKNFKGSWKDAIKKLWKPYKKIHPTATKLNIKKTPAKPKPKPKHDTPARLQKTENLFIPPSLKEKNLRAKERVARDLSGYDYFKNNMDYSTKQSIEKAIKKAEIMRDSLKKGDPDQLYNLWTVIYLKNILKKY